MTQRKASMLQPLENHLESHTSVSTRIGQAKTLIMDLAFLQRSVFQLRMYYTLREEVSKKKQKRPKCTRERMETLVLVSREPGITTGLVIQKLQMEPETSSHILSVMENRDYSQALQSLYNQRELKKVSRKRSSSRRSWKTRKALQKTCLVL